MPEQGPDDEPLGPYYGFLTRFAVPIGIAAGIAAAVSLLLILFSGFGGD